MSNRDTPSRHAAIDDALRGRVEETCRYLQSLPPTHADVVVIAGSGLGSFVREIEPELAVSFSGIPHVGGAGVAGHAGRLVAGRVGGRSAWLLAGRRHLYEGLPAANATLLLRALLLAFPIRCVVVTNAAGGLNPLFQVGDLMLISDQINWMFANPLRGACFDGWGTRFPDMSNAYSARLRAIARTAASRAGVTLREGVYLACPGPSYETRSEIRMLRGVFAADAVGMSTVPETLVATQMGREVLGLSFISNSLAEPGKTTHEEVVGNARLVERNFASLMRAVLPEL